jgi:hypothetical protein
MHCWDSVRYDFTPLRLCIYTVQHMNPLSDWLHSLDTVLSYMYLVLGLEHLRCLY